jgi:3,4-dihydroxy 2-butanone 4-phosphate synthase/GTP cyclohydrolase II
VALNAKPRDLVQPGHVFPVRAEIGGVLKRAGHAEGGCDLARLAGHEPAAVIAEVLNDDGTLATGAALRDFARTHGLALGSIASLIQFRLLNEATVSVFREGEVQTAWGRFRLSVFRERESGALHTALSLGSISADEPVLVRVHLQASLRDLLGTKVPGQPQGWNASRCLERIAHEGAGVFVLLDQPETTEYRLASIATALGDHAAALPPRAPNTNHTLVGVGSQILRHLGVGRMRVMGPRIRYNALSGFGLEVVDYLAYE